MKARDSVKNYDSKIREYVNYSYRQSKNACKSYGPRPAGSDSEKELQKHLVSELETCADSVKTEAFTFVKTTSFSENFFTLMFFVLATALVIPECFGVFSDETLPAIGCAIFVILGVANLFTGFTSKIFAKKTESENIFAVRNADKEASKRLVLTANSDSSPKHKFAVLPFMIVSVAGFVLSIVTMFLSAAFDLFATVPGLKFASLALILFIPFALIPVFADSKAHSEGASKNLSGSFASIAVLKYLKDNGIEMPSLEICVLITSAHEYDCAGAKAFVKAHADDFKDVPTVFVNLDSVAWDESNLGILKSKNSGAEAEKLISEGQTDNGISFASSPVQGKYTPDSSVFSAKGFDALALTSMPADYAKAADTFEDMKIKTLETVLKTVVSGAFLYEEK